jgi:hypothetical protein
LPVHLIWQAFDLLLHLNPAPHGGLGRAPAGHSFHTGAPASQPFTTQPPLGATRHPGPQDSLVSAIATPVGKPASSTARSISLIKVSVVPGRRLPNSSHTCKTTGRSLRSGAKRSLQSVRNSASPDIEEHHLSSQYGKAESAHGQTITTPVTKDRATDHTSALFCARRRHSRPIEMTKV